MKRRGFTLIELMVVIAIIIILAAIAIPNYLNMTARARKSRVASDFSALATALESYRTDWNEYPTSPTTGVATNLPDGNLYMELTGTNTATAVATGVNNLKNGKGTTGAGDSSPITYMTGSILTAMNNPYNTTSPYLYTSTDGKTWTLSAKAAGQTGVTGDDYWMRKDTTTDLSASSTAQ